MNIIPPIQPQVINMESEKKSSKIQSAEPYSTKETSEVKDSEIAVFEKSESEKKVTYKVDMEKVNAMKADTDQRLLELFSGTIKSGVLKQVGGLRGYLSKLINGENIDESLLEEIGIEIEITPESIEAAKVDTAEDGYWGVEATSDRFLEFAQALSGGDPSKADMLLDAVKEGYTQAEEIWGSELPELSQNTLTRTIEKFEAWRDGTLEVE